MTRRPARARAQAATGEEDAEWRAVKAYAGGVGAGAWAALSWAPYQEVFPSRACPLARLQPQAIRVLLPAGRCQPPAGLGG